MQRLEFPPLPAPPVLPNQNDAMDTESDLDARLQSLEAWRRDVETWATDVNASLRYVGNYLQGIDRWAATVNAELERLRGRCG